MQLTKLISAYNKEPSLNDNLWQYLAENFSVGPDYESQLYKISQEVRHNNDDILDNRVSSQTNIEQEEIMDEEDI